MKEEKIRQIIDNLWYMALKSRKHMDEPRRAAHERTVAHHQIFCLAMLRDTGGGSMSELARKMGVSSQQMTRVVNDLKNLGCAKRYIDENNRRHVLVKITEEGERTLDAQFKAAYDYMAHKFEIFSDEELDECLCHLAALTKYWDRLQD